MNCAADKNSLLVIGHKNPDTDAICAAIGQAYYLRTKGETAYAGRCGEIPARTAWVLEQAGVEEPPLIQHVRPTAGFIAKQIPHVVCESDTLLRAYIAMRDDRLRSLPVVNARQQVVGLVQFYHLLQLLMPQETEGYGVRRVSASLANVAKVLDAQVLGGGELFDTEEELIVLVGASSLKDVEQRLALATKEGLVGRFLVTCGDRPDVQRSAIEAAVRMLVITGGNGMQPDLLELAHERGIPVLSVQQDTASCAMLLRCARSVSHQMRQDFITFNRNTPLSVVRAEVAKAETQDLFPIVDEHSGALYGVLGKSDLVDPPAPPVVMVDHNEFGQAVNGIEEAEIRQVIDHHRLGGDIQTREPISVMNEPVGSTSTLVGREFFRNQVEVPPGIAMCLSAGILSDTLNLTSPTTTPLDREILSKLCEIGEIDAAEFTKKFFEAGSILQTGSAAEVVDLDCKQFVELGWCLSVSQIEELGFGRFEDRRQEVEQALEAKRREGGYDFACLLLTDISTHESLLLVAGNSDIAEAIDYPSLDATLFKASGVVSRKKQLFPALCRALRQIGENPNA